MGNVLVFSKPARLGGQVQNVPFSDVAWQVARLLDLQHDELLELQLHFHMNGRVTLIIGWPEDEPLAMPFCAGELDILKHYLGLYQEAVEFGGEPNPCLAAFHRATTEGGPYWSFLSPNAVKFPLGC